MKDRIEDKILIGKIVGAAGIRGEIKVYSYAESSESFLDASVIYLIDGGEKGGGSGPNHDAALDQKVYRVETARSQGAIVVLKLNGVDDRNAAETLVDYGVYIEEESLDDLPDDTYYVKDLIGLKVISHANGEEVGTIKDVLQNTPQDVYVIQRKTGEGQDILVPGVKEFVQEINIKEGRIVIEFIEGMM